MKTKKSAVNVQGSQFLLLNSNREVFWGNMNEHRWPDMKGRKFVLLKINNLIYLVFVSLMLLLSGIVTNVET